MDYLTDDDLKAVNVADESLLDKAIQKAEELLDVNTRYYYDTHSFDDDVDWRKKAVKRALLAQVEYFIETGETTAEGINSMPQSVSIGRTSVTTVHGNSAKKTKSLLCEEFYLHLSGTGLLYKGIGS